MPISYASNVSGNDKLFFVKLILRWYGSVYQAVYGELIVFLLAYTCVSLIYNLALTETQQLHYIHFMKYVQILQTGTPLSFMLGFFVAAMIDRWWRICLYIPWMNTPAFLIQSYVPACVHVTSYHGPSDEQQPVDRQLRRCILRYLNLAWVLQMLSISQSVRDRFPMFEPAPPGQGSTIRKRLEGINEDDKVQETFGELVNESEIKTFESIASYKNEASCDAAIAYWVPIQWASRLLQRGHDAGLIAKDRRYRELTQMLADFRSYLGTIWLYADTSVPLVYVQVVIIAVYSYFFAEIFTTQISAYNPPRNDNSTETVSETIMDPYIPFTSILKFLFYVGWFKVAVALLDPLGNDAQDFPLNTIFDYNLDISRDCGLAEGYFYPPEMDIYKCIDEDENETEMHRKGSRTQKAARIISLCAMVGRKPTIEAGQPTDSANAPLLAEDIVVDTNI